LTRFTIKLIVAHADFARMEAIEADSNAQLTNTLGHHATTLDNMLND